MVDEQTLILPKKRYHTLIIIAGVAIAVFFDWALYMLIPTKGMTMVSRWFISRLTIWAVLPILYQYSTRIEGRNFLIWKEKPQRAYFYIAAVAVLFLAIFFVQWITRIPYYLGFRDNFKVLRSVSLLMRQNRPLFVFTCFTAGITEELLIRGYVLPRLSLLFKSKFIPVLISSLFFSLWHYGYYNLSEIIFTFLFGLLSALFYQKYKNIKILMIFHFLYDLVIDL